MRVYIAGPMTGIADNNVPAFEAAKAELRDSSAHDVVSPVDISRRMGFDPRLPVSQDAYRALLAEDLRSLLCCDAVVLLKGWSESNGATLERTVALAVGLRVFYGVESLLAEVKP